MADSTATTKHIGDLIVTKKNVNDVAHLTEVTGNLYIEADAQLPVLTSVGGYLFIDADARLPVLTSVGGNLFIAIGVSFDHSSIEFGAGRVLAVHEYALHIKDGEYRAGCRGPWSAEQSLKHWNTGHYAPTRAEKFRAAIAAQEGSHE